MYRIYSRVLFLFLMGWPVFAVAEINCPPTELVKGLQFLKAEGTHDIWDLTSKTFSYAGKSWQVLFTVYLPRAKNTEEALQQGEYFYQTQIEFFDPPMGRNRGDADVCYYAQQESTYFVRAISLSASMLKELKTKKSR